MAISIRNLESVVCIFSLILGRHPTGKVPSTYPLFTPNPAFVMLPLIDISQKIPFFLYFVVSPILDDSVIQSLHDNLLFNLANTVILKAKKEYSRNGAEDYGSAA